MAWFALLAIPAVFLIAWATERRGGLAQPEQVPLAIAVALVFFLATLPSRTSSPGGTKPRRTGSRSRRRGIRRRRRSSTAGS